MSNQNFPCLLTHPTDIAFAHPKRYSRNTDKHKVAYQTAVQPKYTRGTRWLYITHLRFFLIVLGFNDTSTLVGHFVSSPTEREKRDRRDCRKDEREGQVRKTNKNESKETEEIKHSPSTLTCYKGNRPCPIVSQYQLDAPVT